MILLDKPYVSEIFRKTIVDNEFLVVETNSLSALSIGKELPLITENDVIRRFKSEDNCLLYSNSENSIDWIVSNLAFTELPKTIALFKDKTAFRQLTCELFPNFFFKQVKIEELVKLNVDNLPMPFIIKPNVGFFSIGVHKVSTKKEWDITVKLILDELQQANNLYPKKVLNLDSFIIEECIEGEEYAVDAYFNSRGEAVIVGIFKHVFSSESDVSDRIYITSENIISSNLDRFTNFLNNIGRLANLSNFPVHVELRVNDKDELIPIEVNPMRFGGWCTTADRTYSAFNVNPYNCFLQQLKPDWHSALKDKKGKIFSIIILDNSTGIEAANIESFDYEKCLSQLENVSEVRKVDHTEYPLFGFVFAETRENNFSELRNLLDSDLSEFLVMKPTD